MLSVLLKNGVKMCMRSYTFELFLGFNTYHYGLCGAFLITQAINVHRNSDKVQVKFVSFYL